jgi:hypothetical protein
MKIRSVLLLALITASSSALAQQLKPGLWEVRSAAQAAGGEMAKDMAEMQKQLASMPPEQRKMMQDMMAKHGVTLGNAGPGGMNLRVCMTREMVERNEIPAQQGDCKSTASGRTGNTMKVSFTCTNPPSSGEGTVMIVSPEAYTMRMSVNAKAQGKAQRIDMDAAGKWVAADCGAVKPLIPAKK